MKSTIPEGIVKFLQLEEKDELEWQMDIKNNERIAIVKKARSQEELDEETRKLVSKHVRPEKMRNHHNE
jgi:antitoxin component of MazEF toxin-antitoxin module